MYKVSKSINLLSFWRKSRNFEETAQKTVNTEWKPKEGAVINLKQH